MTHTESDRGQRKGNTQLQCCQEVCLGCYCNRLAVTARPTAYVIGASSRHVCGWELGRTLQLL